MHKILALLLLSTLQTNFAFSSALKDKHSRFQVSADNFIFNRFSSQETGTNAAFSLSSAIDHLYNHNPNILSGLLALYGEGTVTLWNHEITGHVMRGREFYAKISGLRYKSPFSASTEFATRPLHIQQNAIIDTAGIEASYLLSQKITWQAMQHGSTITPAIGAAYMLSSMDQLMYIMRRIPSNPNSGNDIQHYLNYSQSTYGAGALTANKLRSVGWLDLLDPMLFASAYSIATHRPIDPPMMKVGSFKFMPVFRLILTPYGVLEKRLVTYVKTPKRIVKLSFGFGQEQKTSIAPLNIHRYGYIGELINHANTLPTLPLDPKQHNTYYAEIVVDKVVSFDALDLGFTGAIWSQPELFTQTPYYSPIKRCGMIIINANYHYKGYFDVLVDLGYKQKGFVLGQPTKATPIIRAGLNWGV